VAVVGAKESGAPADCTIVVGVGDGLACDVELARWALGVGGYAQVPPTEFAAVSLSRRDLETVRERGGAAFLASSGLPFVATRPSSSKQGDPLFPPYQSVSCSGHTIALLGLAQPGDIPDAAADQPAASLWPLLQELGGKADILILLSNAGPEVDRLLAGELKGIDVVVGGGEAILEEPEAVPGTGTLLARPGYPGRSVSVLHLTFDRAGRLQRHTWERLLFTPQM